MKAKVSLSFLHFTRFTGSLGAILRFDPPLWVLKLASDSGERAEIGVQRYVNRMSLLIFELMRKQPEGQFSSLLGSRGLFSSSSLPRDL